MKKPRKGSESMLPKAADLRKLAEKKAIADEIKAGKSLSSPVGDFQGSPQETRRVLHELRVHQIELEMQNTELRRTQAELDSAQARYFDLFDQAPVGYVTISKKGLILEANLTAATLLDVAPGALVKRPLTQFIRKEDQNIYFLYRKQLFATGEPQAFDLRMKKKDGSIFWARLEATTVPAFAGTYADRHDDGGSPVSRIMIINISERKLMESQREAALEALHDSLAGKEVLLKEVHHRVKNNLTAIVGLLQLQRQTVTDPVAVALFRELEGRIRSMALVHEKLYHFESLNRIDLQDYIEKLIAELRVALAPRTDIRISVAAAGVKMGLDNAVPCGLILNELITNALKYAFPGDQPRAGEKACAITVAAELDGAGDDGVYTLTVADNGVGLPVDLDWATTKTLGLRLVRILGQYQLKGRIELDRANGTSFRLVFASRQREKG